MISLSLPNWAGPFDAKLSRAAVEVLEAGRVLLLPKLALQPRPEEVCLLSEDGLLAVGDPACRCWNV
jgi:hypothetical protein